MTVSLTKGGNVNLSKEAGDTGLTIVTLGLGWDVRTTTGTDFDLDASAVVLQADGKVKDQADDLIYFNHLKNAAGTVVHTGDNLTGEGSGDDEQIKVNLAGLSADKVVLLVNIYQASSRGGQNFGQVRNAFIRVVNDNDDKELARYDLTEDASTETAMVFGELYRHGSEWKFRAVGQGGEYSGLLAAYGL